MGAGLALLIAMAGSLILFPNVVGARASHAAVSQRVARTSRVQIVQVSAPLAANRDLATVARARVANRSVQRSRSSSGLRAVQGAGRGTMRNTRSGTLYRTAAISMGATRSGMVYRTDTNAGSAYAHTGHSCPGMSMHTSTSSTTTGK
jgi:hypothetical protein